MSAYFNTNRETGSILAGSKQKAKKQEQLIYDFFAKYPATYFSAQDIHILVFTEETPITSVRRAITNLTTEGKLVKTEYMKQSKYHKSIHCWIFAENNQRKQISLFQ